jgi:hypothetical protein
MIRLHAGSGSWEIQLLGPHGAEEDWQKLRSNVIRLLRARKRPGVGLLEKLPWRLYDGTNYFGDEFCLLYAKVPIDSYVDVAEYEHNQEAKAAASSLASTFEELGTYVRFVAFEADLEPELEPIAAPQIRTNAVATARALTDADHLLQTQGAVSAVDRVHTALHGYLRDICREADLKYESTDTIAALWKRIRTAHPRFTSSIHGEHVTRIAQGMATVLDALGSVRNNASVAHANEHLLTEPEAMLAVNAARTLLHYLDASLRP